MWNIKKDMVGSSLLTAGCHALDALVYFMGHDVQEVRSDDALHTHEIIFASDKSSAK